MFVSRVRKGLGWRGKGEEKLTKTATAAAASKGREIKTGRVKISRLNSLLIKDLDGAQK